MEVVSCLRDGPVLTVTINRPEKLNALSVEVFRYLQDILGDLPQNIQRGVRAVLLTGAGDKAFVAGADIQQMSQMSPEEGREFAALAQGVTEQIEAAAVPFIACVNGHALGGGCELATSCDFIYATARSSFGQPEVNLGLIPGFGGCVRLQRLIGPARAREMIYTGIPLSAREALDAGLVNRVFATAEEMSRQAIATAKTIAEKSPTAIALSKRALNRQHGLSTHQGLNVELDAFEAAFRSAEKVEGVSAFLQKRKPLFS